MQLMDNDKLITCGNDGLIKMWDKYVIYAIVIYRNKGTIKMPLEGHTKAVLSIQFNQTKRILVSGSADRSVKIWKPQPTWQCV
jgi:WD40 repeat protein